MTLKSRRLRALVALVVVVLPAGVRRRLMNDLLGHVIDAGASIGRSFVDVDRLVMGPGAVIGHLTVIRGCSRVEMGEEALIGNLNFINAVRLDKEIFSALDRDPSVVLGDRSRITTMHFVDASDRVELAERASIAGFWSLLMTHTFDYRASRQSTMPISVGLRSVVSSRSTLLPGSQIGERCIVAANSTVTGRLEGDATLWGGTPARKLKDLDAASRFFQRTENALR